MSTDVLEVYYRIAGMEAPFVWQRTSLWRGYIGTWEIKEGRLYLIDLDGFLNNGKTCSLEDIFPGFASRVFAHWFSGRLCAPQGKLLDYVHMGFKSTYEFDLLLDIDRGVVIKTELKSNVESDDGNTRDHDRRKAWAIFGR